MEVTHSEIQLLVLVSSIEGTYSTKGKRGARDVLLVSVVLQCQVYLLEIPKDFRGNCNGYRKFEDGY
jgi:hypothetical protein